MLLHANTGSWQYNIPNFVEASYLVIAFDRYGGGGSTANPDTSLQPGSIAEDLHVLLGHLKSLV